MPKIKRFLVYLAGFLLVSSIAGLATYMFLSSGRPAEAPNLIGKGLEEAKKEAEGRGFTVYIEAEVYDRSVPSGHIIGQETLPGTRIKGGGEIKVTLSKGPSAVPVLSALGSSLEEARALFGKTGLKIANVITVHSDEIDTGRVLAQRPAPGEVETGPITLVVSKGPYDVVYYSPSFEGMQKGDALSLAGELGLEVRPSGAGDTVSGQRPEPGAPIKEGDTVYLRMEGGAVPDD